MTKGKYRPSPSDPGIKLLKLFDAIRNPETPGSEVFELSLTGGFDGYGFDDEIWAFYWIRGNHEVKVHVRGLVKESTMKTAAIKARIVSNERMREIEYCDHPATYHSTPEQEAYITVKELPHFRDGLSIPYDAATLIRLLVEDAPEYLAQKSCA